MLDYMFWHVKWNTELWKKKTILTINLHKALRGHPSLTNSQGWKYPVNLSPSTLTCSTLDICTCTPHTHLSHILPNDWGKKEGGFKKHLSPTRPDSLLLTCIVTAKARDLTPFGEWFHFWNLPSSTKFSLQEILTSSRISYTRLYPHKEELTCFSN